MARLKELLYENKTNFIMEAHDALSAKIVEQVGFQGVWGSGLSISAAHGYRDLNELSCSELVNTIDRMTNVVNIPVLVDIDTGYGDFNNARLCVKKLEKVGAEGVSIEDKVFPKSNSYLNKSRHELIDIKEFQAKIRAIRDYTKEEFCIVARTEALIAQYGIEEALERAEKYREAGADAIFVHSKSNTIDEISKFMKEWNNKCPVVISPTTYDETMKNVYEELGISLVIWGNYMLRASIHSMKDIGSNMVKDGTPKNIKNKIAYLNEVFELQGMKEYYEMKEKYMGVHND